MFFILFVVAISLNVISSQLFVTSNAQEIEVKKLKEKSNNVFEFKEGTLYPILHSLEEEGLISSYWDDTTGKKRKYYAITTKGKKSLKEKNEEWKIFSESVNRVIGGVSFAN